MGRGGGGGGRGRRAARGGGGGAAEATEALPTVNPKTTAQQPAVTGAQNVPIADTPVPAIQRGENFPGQKAFEAANPNLTINAEGIIEVGSRGAPKVNKDMFTEAEAVQHLKDLGFKLDAVRTIDGLNSAQEVASILPKGSKVLGQGQEGVGVRLPDGTVARVQYGGGTPEMYYVGDAAVYSTWKTTAGKVVVEGKPYIESADALYKQGKISYDVANKYARAAIEKRGQQFNPSLVDRDLHAGNIGINPATGKWVEFDPGGFQKLGRQPVNRWKDSALGRQIRAAEARGLDKEMRRGRGK